MKKLGHKHALLFTVDCGSSPEAEPALAAAKQAGTDVVVVDHHPCEKPPASALCMVNPNQSLDTSGLGHLCAATVVYMFLRGATQKLAQAKHPLAEEAAHCLHECLDLAALATVADSVALKGINRAFVREGLQVMTKQQRPGIKALCEHNPIPQQPDEVTLGWFLGPCLNAPGRIGDDALLASKLLLEPNQSKADGYALQCHQINTERKEMQTAALQKAATSYESGKLLIWAADEDWHPGIVGIIAGRLAEHQRRPAICMTLTGATAKGSARATPGFNIGGAIKQALQENLLLRGGGHKAAAGLELKRDGLEGAMERIDEVLAATAPDESETGITVAGLLTPPAATPELLDSLARGGPYGREAPAPKFVFPRIMVSSIGISKDAHYRLGLGDKRSGHIRAMAFGVLNTPLGNALARIQPGTLIDAMGTLALDTYRGGESVMLKLEDFSWA